MDLSATIHLLGDILGEVISEIESPAIFGIEERVRLLAKARRSGNTSAAGQLQSTVAALSPDEARAVASAFTVYFDLVNLAEEEHRVATLRKREAESGDDSPVAESIEEAVASLQRCGVTAQQMAGLLKRLKIELVLTAHPTEAKRRTILSKLQRIAAHIHTLNAAGSALRERRAAGAGLHSEITSIWLTERTRTARPSVTDEVRTGLFYVDEIFWEVLPRIYTDLDDALARHYPGQKMERPWLTLASWIGGDRDGNPNVTADVTAETLRLHRGLAIEKFRRDLGDLSRQLSISGLRVPPSAELQAWLNRWNPLPPHAAYLENRYPDEPYRLALSLLAAELADASRDDMKTHLLSSEAHAARVVLADFTRPLALIAQVLPPAITGGWLRTFQRQLAIFELHAARLDIREDSARLNAALAELLRALNIAPDFEHQDAAERLAVLSELLSQSRPELAEHAGVTVQTAATWSLFELIGRARCVYGETLLGPFIISMAHDAADVLAVLLLARWTGCSGGLQIAPLFETRHDLQRAPQVLADLFGVEAYREHLAASGNLQMVMIGYSDSNKDSGYLAANWALYQAQEQIARVCDGYGIEFTLFHGRGGTIARGGGPANRAIRAQPPGTVRGRFRVTEQGEIIAARYSNHELAHRHLEQLVSAVLLSSAPEPAPEAGGTAPFSVGAPAGWRSAMSVLAENSWQAYRRLVYETPGFMDFWQAATPIDEITRLHIGSRPATRRRGTLDVARVRAIPWVFSWMQARYNLPAWYGLGSGLAVGLSGEGGITTDLLREMYAEWPFFQVLLDNAEMALIKADMEIAALYTELVPDRRLAERIFSDIRAEYQRTQEAVLTIAGHDHLLDADPVIQRSVHLRNPYVDPLNYIQVDLLRRLRALSDPESSEADTLRHIIFLTINGIAAGLRNTG